MKIKCNQCGDLNLAYLDGYIFGDILLEDVLFEVRIQKGHLKTKGVTPDSQSYFESLNKAKWVKEANNVLKEAEQSSDGEVLHCPSGFSSEDHAISLLNDDGTLLQPTVKRPVPVEIQTLGGADLIKLFKGLK
jgi:hypothetical protein